MGLCGTVSHIRVKLLEGTILIVYAPDYSIEVGWNNLGLLFPFRPIPSQHHIPVPIFPDTTIPTSRPITGHSLPSICRPYFSSSDQTVWPSDQTVTTLPSTSKSEGSMKGEYPTQFSNRLRHQHLDIDPFPFHANIFSTWKICLNTPLTSIQTERCELHDKLQRFYGFRSSLRCQPSEIKPV